MKLQRQINNPGCVYITTNKNKTTLYTGVTTNLLKRISEHKYKKYPNSFTLNIIWICWFILNVMNQLRLQLRKKKELKQGAGNRKLN